MNSWLPHLLISCALFAGSWLTGPRTERSVAEIGRPIAGPMALPFLWRGLSRSIREGSPEETIARGRMLLRLLPCWFDGHLYLAHMLAFESTAPAGDADEAIDRLLASLVLLDEAGELCPSHSVEFLLAQAFFVEFGTSRAPGLAAVFRERVGQDALQVADAYLARAESSTSRLQARIHRAYLTKRMVGLALRDNEPARAVATARRAMAQLAEVSTALGDAGHAPAADNATAHRSSLERLARFLEGDPGVDADRLRTDPFLDDITATLPDLLTRPRRNR